jgi:hypothetical protein
MFAGAVSGFNDIRGKKVHASSWKVIDELMSACCPKTGCMLNLEIQRLDAP